MSEKTNTKKKMVKIELEIKAIIWEDGKGAKECYRVEDVLYRGIDDLGEIPNKIAMAKLPNEVAKEIRAAFCYVELINIEKDYLRRAIKDHQFEDCNLKIELEKKLSFLEGLFPE